MTRSFKKVAAVGLAALMVSATAVPAFADTTADQKYDTASVGSVAADVSAATSVDEDFLDSNANYDGASVNSKTSGVTGYDDVQNRESEYQIASSFAESGSETYSTYVYATIPEGDDVGDQEGDILVQIPKVVILSGETAGSGVYTVRVKGNIAGDSVVSVIPASTVTLHQAGKADVVAGITQSIVNFVAQPASFEFTQGEAPNQKAATVGTRTVTAANTAAAGVIASDVWENNGEVTANTTGTIAVDGTTNKLTSGSWKGTYDFTVSFAHATYPNA